MVRCSSGTHLFTSSTRVVSSISTNKVLKVGMHKKKNYFTLNYQFLTDFFTDEGFLLN